MRDLQRTGARILRAEATVGAGLPVIDTLEMLLATGDRIHRVDGSLSGTLAFLMERLESGQPFSEAVRDAEAGGYTEPDPVADLTGDDVVRKAIIISRIGGLSPAHIEIEQEGWVDSSLAGLPLAELLERLKAYDKPIADRLAAARERGEVIRFVASVEPGRIRVGPQSLPLDAPLARLARTDNMIVISSERYDQRPLVVTGPGAGVQVTAMGVLSDILRIIAERG
jgi:homoserine dehydrogenase